MKKGIIVAVFAFFAVLQTQAQVTFMPGIRGGVNFSHFSEGDHFFFFINDEYDNPEKATFSSKTDFYVGGVVAIKFAKFYTLQPEINYTKQGSNVEYTDTDYSGSSPVSKRVTTKYDLSYVGISAISKFTFGKAMVQIGPVLDFLVENTKDVNIHNNMDMDFSFTAGLGFNFTKNIGIEARVKRGIMPVVEIDNYYHDNIVFQLGATYLFDIK